MPKPTPAFDPRSDRLVLRYVGDGRPLNGVPARDLTESDLCRIAYERALTVGTRPDPRAPDQAAVAAIRDELLARGQFALASSPATPAEPAPTPEG